MKDYKEILEGIVDIINTTEKSDIGFTNICTYIGEQCPELIEDEDKRIRKELERYFKELKQQNFISFTKDGPNIDDILAWLSKQSEQKPTDEVKPKFKVDDWIVYDNDKLHAIALIVAIDYDMYKVELYNGINCVSHTDYIDYIDKNYHLWTIRYAKDGDVLVSNHSPFIYNGKFNEITVGAYCGLNVINSFVVSTGEIRWTSNQFIKPATKEQSEVNIDDVSEYIDNFNAVKKYYKRKEDDKHAEYIYVKSYVPLYKSIVNEIRFCTNEAIIKQDCSIYCNITNRYEETTKEEYDKALERAREIIDSLI